MTIALKQHYIEKLEGIRVSLGEKSIARTIYRLVEEHESHRTERTPA